MKAIRANAGSWAVSLLTPRVSFVTRGASKLAAHRIKDFVYGW